MLAFPAPQAANAEHRACRSTGSVRVIRCGGGLGESLIAATQQVSSWNRTETARKDPHVGYKTKLLGQVSKGKTVR